MRWLGRPSARQASRVPGDVPVEGRGLSKSTLGETPIPFSKTPSFMPIGVLCVIRGGCLAAVVVAAGIFCRDRWVRQADALHLGKPEYVRRCCFLRRPAPRAALTC